MLLIWYPSDDARKIVGISSGLERLSGTKVPKPQHEFAGRVRCSPMHHISHAFFEFPEVLASDQFIGAASYRTNEPGGDWFAMRLTRRYGIADARSGVSGFPMTSRHTNDVVWRAKKRFQSALNALDQGRAIWFNASGVARNATRQGTFGPLGRSCREQDRS